MRYIILGLILATFFQLFFWITQDHQVTLTQDSSDKIQSLSYSPYFGYEKKVLTPQRIQKDLELLSSLTNKVRTYSTYDASVILNVASKTSMKIDLGLWLSSNYENNLLEIQHAFELLKTYDKNIDSIIVGNETLLREELNSVELMAYLQLIKEQTQKPITTAEV